MGQASSRVTVTKILWGEARVPTTSPARGEVSFHVEVVHTCKSIMLYIGTVRRIPGRS